MNSLSDPTLGILIEAAADANNEEALKTLLMRADLDRWLYEDELRRGKHGLLRAHLLAARDNAASGDTDALRGLLKFTQMVVERAVPKPENPPYLVGGPPYWFSELREALLADGYELRWEDTHLPFTQVRYEIQPTDATAVPLADEISALERELATRGFTTALTHYRQAVDNFTHHKFESANGDLRTALEDLVTTLAEQVGYVRKPKAGQGGSAVNYLTKRGHLSADDGGTLLEGLWALTHTNGPHPGQSNADEARFRMQVITAVLRFLLQHFPSP